MKNIFNNLRRIIRKYTKNRFHLSGRAIRFFFQRQIRGWDNSVTWSLDYSLSKIILPRLKKFKELHNGYPNGLTSEKWEEILDKMIFAFEFLGSEDRWDKIGVKYNGDWDRAKEGIKLFGKYYMDLWW